MTLVDYGSDSDSDGKREDSEPVVSRPVLPPPSRTAPTALPSRGRKLQLPALAASTLQAVAELDSKPADKVEDDQGPVRKKPKLGGGAGKGGGLASMLPPPKSGAANVRPAPASTTAPPAAPQVEPLPVPTKEPALDFFGLGSFASPAPRTTTPSAVDAAPSIASSAPIVKEETPPPPSLLDPYPGYWQRQSGEWVARDAATDPVWAAFYQEHYAREDEDEAERTGTDGIVEFDAAEEARKAREARPEIIDPKEEARQQAEAEAEIKPQKAISRVAKGRHQLSSLLADAQSNRADLEERIARGKVNRRAAGSRYGF